MKKTIAPIIAATTLLLTGCSTTPQHAGAKWEYQKVWDFPTVQKMGTEGWTLVGFHSFDPGDNGTYYILKRRVQ
jgi:hypothetical protein